MASESFDEVVQRGKEVISARGGRFTSFPGMIAYLGRLHSPGTETRLEAARSGQIPHTPSQEQ